MTNEEMHRTMEFITEQQALFAASIQRLQEERTFPLQYCRAIHTHAAVP